MIAVLRTHIRYNWGYGVPTNLARAVELYTAAAEMGNAVSQYQLGIKFRDGNRGCPQSHTRSVHYLTLASE